MIINNFKKKFTNESINYILPTTITNVLTSSMNTKISSFNTELTGYIMELTGRQSQLNASVYARINIDPSYQGHRNKGVALAKTYEIMDLKMGGKGTGKYSRRFIKEVLKSNKIRGYQGHHINSVSINKELQADANNIVFLKEKDHLATHNGDFKNSTTGNLINKNEMLRKTNMKRIIKTEMFGVGISAVLGFGGGFALSFVIDIINYGVSKDNVKPIIKRATKMGVANMGLTTITYGASRLLSPLLLNSSVLCSLIKCSISFVIISAFDYVRMRFSGSGIKESLISVGESFIKQIPSLVLFFLLSYATGPIVGAIITAAIKIISFFIKSKSKEKEVQNFDEKIQTKINDNVFNDCIRKLEAHYV